MKAVASTPQESGFNPFAISRPHARLMVYYVLVALCTGPAFPIVILPLLFKYETLHYKFDETGLSVRWGILFRREIHLTYRRIQDIHLTRNIVQRWMGLATVTVQTASGGVGPQLTIEGILEAEPLRDFLYRQMRGARGEGSDAVHSGETTVPGRGRQDEALSLLHEIRDLLRESAARKEGAP
jgi:putative membrane protein